MSTRISPTQFESLLALVRLEAAQLRFSASHPSTKSEVATRQRLEAREWDETAAALLERRHFMTRQE